MAKIIYRDKFFCPICKRDVKIRLFGEPTLEINEALKQDVKEWGKHYHWIDHHRYCAICGDIVKSGDLELLIDNGAIKIHGKYNEWYKKPTRGLLIVHKRCIKKTVSKK